MVAEHLPGYQARDFEVVDYQMYSLDTTGLSFRGPPLPDCDSDEYFCCLGAAQTFGCFCERPYPVELGQAIGLAALNLGYGGAGPYFFLKHAELFPYINQSRFVVVQVMSGRSASNSLFESGGLEYLARRRDGKRFSAADAWRSVLEGNYHWNRLPFGKLAARKFCQYVGRRRAKRLVEETRQRWLDDFGELLERITVPKLLFWFSVRAAEYVPDYRDVNTLFGEFPQLIDRSMVDQLRRKSDDYVECVSQRGLPQRLYSRFTGNPCTVDLGKDRRDFAGITWSHNPYYPSPEMHQDAAHQLLQSSLIRRAAQANA